MISIGRRLALLLALGLASACTRNVSRDVAATIYTDEQAFLHNGRLDDVGSVWTYVPEAMGFSVVLAQPACVSWVPTYTGRPGQAAFDAAPRVCGNPMSGSRRR
jgi:hypothetical protein